MTTTVPTHGGPAHPVRVVTDGKAIGRVAMRAYGFTSEADAIAAGYRCEGGPAMSVIQVTQAQLNSGQYVLDGDPKAMPLYAASAGAKVEGGYSQPVFVVGGEFQAGSGWSNVAAPNAAFSFVPFTIQKNGNSFRPDPTFDLRTYSGIDAMAGIDYYVDPVLGNDGNNGLSWATAKQSTAAAVYATTPRIVYLRPGIYTFGSGDIGNAVAMIGVGGQAIFTSHAVQTYSAVDAHYESTYATAIVNVVDLSQTNADGSYVIYTKKTSAAEVDAAAGSWYWAANKLYVHCTADRAPDANIIVCRNATSGIVTGGFTVDTVKYFENITTLAPAARSIYAYMDHATARLKLFTKNCIFSHGWTASSNNNLLSIIGGVDVISQDCVVEYGPLDGYNYHKAPFTQSPTFIEINNIARYCGLSGTTNNGSTAHETSIGVRIMGNYSRSYGPVVVDVGGAKTWNLGCEAHHSLAAAGASNSGYMTDNGAATEIWVDSCYSHDNQYDLYAAAQKIYKRNMRGSLEGGAGTIAAY